MRIEIFTFASQKSRSISVSRQVYLCNSIRKIEKCKCNLSVMATYRSAKVDSLARILWGLEGPRPTHKTRAWDVDRLYPDIDIRETNSEAHTDRV